MKPMVTGRIELGHILQMGMMLVVGIGAFYAVSGRADKANEKSAEVAIKMDRIELQTGSRFDRLQEEMHKGFNLVRQQIEAMPVMDERVKANAKTLQETVAVLNAVAARLEKIDRDAHDALAASRRLESRVDRLDQQVNTPVPMRQNR